MHHFSFLLIFRFVHWIQWFISRVWRSTSIQANTAQDGSSCYIEYISLRITRDIKSRPDGCELWAMIEVYMEEISFRIVRFSHSNCLLFSLSLFHFISLMKIAWNNVEQTHSTLFHHHFAEHPSQIEINKKNAEPKV